MSRATKLTLRTASGSEAPSAEPTSFAVFKELVFDHIPLPAWFVSANGREVVANHFWHEKMAILAAKTPEGWLSWLHPEDKVVVSAAWAGALQHRLPFHHQVRLALADGSFSWHIVYAYYLESFDCWLVKFFDIDEMQMAKVRANDDLRHSKSMLDASIDCIKVINPDGNLVDMNFSGCEALGVNPDSGFGMEWLNLLPREIRERGRKALKIARTGTNARFSGKSQLPGSDPFYWDNILTPVLGPDGKVVSILCVSRDITELHVAEQRFKYISEHDDLTGLYNRRVFHSSLKKYLRTVGAQNTSLAVMLIDLDYFKLVNDTLGHVAGDHLLSVLSKRLSRYLPEKAFVARIGGDEFAVIFPGLENREQLQQAGTKLIEDTCKPLSYQGHVISFSLSIGGAVFPAHATDSTALIKAADIALNELKRNGRGGICCFEPSMTQLVDTTRNQLEQAKDIIQNKAILPFYQPKVRLTDGQIIGMEALMRFYNTQGELCFPGDIWAAFENYALVERIGFFIRDRVFADIRQWIDQGLEVVPVSVNASPVEFMRDNYAEKFLQQMQKYALPPELLEVEITEHMFDGRGAGYVFRAIKLLKDKGVRISLDDFGTGYSALANIRDYPVDVIKVDRTFVSSLSQGKEGLAVIKALLLLATQLELDVVAEGIENPEQREFLINEGYLQGQGFLFSAAVPASTISEYLANLATHKLL